MSGRSLRLVVLGMMGRCPFGGQTWLYLNWIRGLHKLGHEVWYVEDDTVWPYDPVLNAITDSCGYAVTHIATCMEQVGLKGRWAYRLGGQEGACYGLSDHQLAQLYRECDVLLNVVGSTDLRSEHLLAPCRVYVETDPVTAELQLANNDEHTREAFGNHQHVATYGENYGSADCMVPLNGLTYTKTRQPLDLDLWPMVYTPSARHFTTIGNYRQSGNDVRYDGETYLWSKHHEWEKFIALPRRTLQTFQLALNVDLSSDIEMLQSNGWQIVSPLQMSLEVFGRYPEYIRQSRAELTVAKDQNVRLRSGWFSERDACYLASGKPVVAQDTGFSNILPTGEGLFAFRTTEEALAAVECINSDYRRHCHGARAIAEEYFEASKVAERLLSAIGVG